MQQALFFSFLKKLDLKNKKGHQNYLFYNCANKNYAINISGF